MRSTSARRSAASIARSAWASARAGRPRERRHRRLRNLHRNRQARRDLHACRQRLLDDEAPVLGSRHQVLCPNRELARNRGLPSPSQSAARRAEDNRRSRNGHVHGNRRGRAAFARPRAGPDARWCRESRRSLPDRPYVSVNPFAAAVVVACWTVWPTTLGTADGNVGGRASRRVTARAGLNLGSRRRVLRGDCVHRLGGLGRVGGGAGVGPQRRCAPSGVLHRALEHIGTAMVPEDSASVTAVPTAAFSPALGSCSMMAPGGFGLRRTAGAEAPSWRPAPNNVSRATWSSPMDQRPEPR